VLDRIYGAGLLIDTVVMNPPFGTKRKGADMEFLSMGLKVVKAVLYQYMKVIHVSNL
jgi:predicted RNA methylase